MKKFFSLALALVMVLGLLPAFVPTAEAASTVNVYKAATAMSIDGVLDPVEWWNIPNYEINNADTVYPVKVYFTYDENNLYIALWGKVAEFTYTTIGASPSTGTTMSLNFSPDVAGKWGNSMGTLAINTNGSINKTGTIFGNAACEVAGLYANGAVTFEVRVPKELITNVSITEGTNFSGAVTFKEGSTTLNIGSFDNRIFSVIPMHSVQYTGVAPTLDGDITAVEWGASDWRVDAAAAAALQQKYGITVSQGRVYGYDYYGGAARNVAEIDCNWTYDANNMYVALSVAEPIGYFHLATGNTHIVDGDTISSRTLTLNLNGRNFSFNVTDTAVTTTAANVAFDYVLDASDGVKNRINLEMAIPLSAIGSNLTAGSTFNGFAQYVVGVGGTTVATVTCTNHSGFNLKDYKYNDVFVLGGATPVPPAAPVSSTIYNQHNVMERDPSVTMNINGEITAAEWGAPTYSTNHCDVIVNGSAVTRRGYQSGRTFPTIYDPVVDYYMTWDAENLYLGYDITFPDAVANGVRFDLLLSKGNTTYTLYPTVDRSGTTDTTRFQTAGGADNHESLEMAITRPTASRMVAEVKIPLSRLAAKFGAAPTAGDEYLVQFGYVDYTGHGYIVHRTHPYSNYKDLFVFLPRASHAADLAASDATVAIVDAAAAELTFAQPGSYIYRCGKGVYQTITTTTANEKVRFDNLNSSVEIQVRKPGDDVSLIASANALSFNVTQPAAPDVSATNETAAFAKDGTITGFDAATMEWRAAGETTYTNAPPINLAPGTYYVRTKVDGANLAIASADKEVTVATGPAIPIAVEIDATSTHKTAYEIGDTLDVTGLKLLVYMNDGNKKIVDGTAVTVEGFDSSAIYVAQPLTVKYTENGVTVETTCNISVVEEILSLEEQNFQNMVWFMYMMQNQKFEISAAATEGGTISDAGIEKVKYGNSQTYTVTADEGYVLKSLIVDGVDVGPITSYTFEKVKADHTISAVFEKAISAISYADVKEDAWYYDDVMTVSELGLMNGTDKGFEPDAVLTRATLVTVLWRLAGEPAANASDFTDVKSGEWYTAAVNWAAANEIVTGFDGKFNPEEPITREQVMAILHRYAERMGYESKAGIDGDYTVSDWAESDVAWANANGIFAGIDVTSETAPTAPVSSTIYNQHTVYTRDTSSMVIDGNITADEWGAVPSYATDHADIEVDGETLSRLSGTAKPLTAGTANYYWTWDAEYLYLAYDITLPSVDNSGVRPDIYILVDGVSKYSFNVSINNAGETGRWGDAKSTAIVGYKWVADDHLQVEVKLPLSQIESKAGKKITDGCELGVQIGFVDYIPGGYVFNRTHPWTATTGYTDNFVFSAAQASGTTGVNISDMTAEANRAEIAAYLARFAKAFVK